jgi:protein-tyrosine phosphatase
VARACTAFAVSLALVGAVFACATQRRTTGPDSVEEPVVERLSPASVRVRWPSTFASGSVAVFVGLSPDAIHRARPLAVVSGATSVTLTTSDLRQIDDDYRLYYELTPTSGAPSLIVAERRLPLQGPDNFRDLGGYATADGRRVRWGRLYRSNDLAGLTGADLEHLSRIGLKLVCDFRSDRERSQRPNRAIEPAPHLSLDLPVDAEGVDPGALQEKIRTGGVAALGTEKLMHTAYRSFVSDHSDRWAVMLRRLAQPRLLPALVHCTAGKDRTGFAAALVLLTLGVPEETIFEDYLLTNRYREDFQRFVLRWVPLYSLFRTEPEDLLPLLEARREYLQASLDAIDELHGSLDTYLADEVGVTPEIRAALRANLLR